MRITEKDIELLSFLKKYKVMMASESKRIYKSKEYHYKRLKQLEKERYIQRINTFKIKLDINGTKLIRDIGYEYYRICRREDYQTRVNEISKIATLTLGSDIRIYT